MTENNKGTGNNNCSTLFESPKFNRDFNQINCNKDVRIRRSLTTAFTASQKMTELYALSKTQFDETEEWENVKDVFKSVDECSFEISTEPQSLNTASNVLPYHNSCDVVLESNCGKITTASSDIIISENNNVRFQNRHKYINKDSKKLFISKGVRSKTTSTGTILPKKTSKQRASTFDLLCDLSPSELEKTHPLLVEVISNSLIDTKLGDSLNKNITYSDDASPMLHSGSATSEILSASVSAFSVSIAQEVLDYNKDNTIDPQNQILCSDEDLIVREEKPGSPIIKVSNHDEFAVIPLNKLEGPLDSTEILPSIEPSVNAADDFQNNPTILISDLPSVIVENKEEEIKMPVSEISNKVEESTRGNEGYEIKNSWETQNKDIFSSEIRHTGSLNSKTFAGSIGLIDQELSQNISELIPAGMLVAANTLPRGFSCGPVGKSHVEFGRSGCTNLYFLKTETTPFSSENIFSPTPQRFGNDQPASTVVAIKNSAKLVIKNDVKASVILPDSNCSVLSTKVSSSRIRFPSVRVGLSKRAKLKSLHPHLHRG